MKFFNVFAPRRFHTRELLVIALVLASLPAFISPIQTVIAQANQHVYYGYVPPSTDLPNLAELVWGKAINFTPPDGYALLDIVAYQDDTRVEIYDITSGLLINSTRINALDKATFYMPYGIYFKVVSNKRVGVLLTGGSAAYEDDPFSGVAAFYPSVNGGFRGTHYIFMPAPATHQYGYSMDLVHHNFYLLALGKGEWRLKDRVGKFETSGSVDPRGTARAIIQSRVVQGGISAAAGYDSVFELTTTGDVLVCSAALGMFVYVPSITGGYVGKLFFFPNHATYQQTGRSAVLVIVPLEAGKVTVYKASDLSVMNERSFTDTDVAQKAYWFLPLGIGRFDMVIESTGDITVLAAQTYGGEVTEDFIGDGITFIGSRPGQEIRFFTPSTAIVFSPADQTATIDGEERRLARDQFVILGSGVHTVKGTNYLIIQVVAPGIGWNKWGSYLIENLDIEASYPEVPELMEKGIPITMYASIGVVAIIAVILLLMLRRRKK